MNQHWEAYSAEEAEMIEYLRRRGYRRARMSLEVLHPVNRYGYPDASTVSGYQVRFSVSGPGFWRRWDTFTGVAANKAQAAARTDALRVLLCLLNLDEEWDEERTRRETLRSL